MYLEPLAHVGDGGGAAGARGREMQVGQRPASVPHPPLSFPETCPGHTPLAKQCNSSQSNAIPAPHVVGTLSLLASPQISPCLPLQTLPTHPLCAHTGASALVAIHQRCSGSSHFPIPLMALLCPSLISILNPALHLPPVLLQGSGPHHNPQPHCMLRTPVTSTFSPPGQLTSQSPPFKVPRPLCLSPTWEPVPRKPARDSWAGQRGLC